jgi:hypothetical protein
LVVKTTPYPKFEGLNTVVTGTWENREKYHRQPTHFARKKDELAVPIIYNQKSTVRANKGVSSAEDAINR